MRLLILEKESCGSERRAQPHGYSLTNLNEHRLDEIGGEKPSASLAVGDQRKHHGAARTRHDRMIAGRKRSRDRRNCNVKRPHELELLGREIRHRGRRLDGGHGNALGRARIQPFVEDAWVVAVTPDGSVFFGTDKVSPSELADNMKSRPRRHDQKFYIKADARAPFADVRSVLTAAHDGAFNEAAFNSVVLLTSQTEPASPGTVVPPKGLEVQIGPHSNAATVIVQVNAGQPSPTFEVNDQKIPAAALSDALRRLLQNRSDTPVLVKTHGPVLFAPVAQAIDACRSIGAKVMLSTPEL